MRPPGPGDALITAYTSCTFAIRRGTASAGYYVGMTGLDPEDRFRNHKNGVKAARVVRKYGERLVPRLYEHLNPMPYTKAKAMEAFLADSLRKRGFAVFGGH